KTFISRNVKTIEAVRRKSTQGVSLLLPIAKNGKSNRISRVGSLQISGPDTDQLLGMGIRQRPENNRVHDAEDCRIRADAQRQSDERNDRKAALLNQHSCAIAHVF